MLIEKIIRISIVIVVILISIAYLTLSERKVMGYMQRRIGPNRVFSNKSKGLMGGIIQPILDGVKLILKEIIVPIYSKPIEILIGPIIILILTLIIWGPMPLSIYSNISTDYINKYEIKSGILLILAISSINVYMYILSGWNSNSIYSYIGSLRSIAQLISYEVSIGIILLSISIINNSLNLHDYLINNIYMPLIIPLLPLSLLFFFSILAETNRPPFDLPEAESELIAGYLIEYGGFAFGSIYLAEYGFILFMSFLFSLLFFSFLLPLFTIFIIYLFIFVRATLPRLRYDQLMFLGWVYILPLSISFLLFNSSFLFLIS